MTTILTGLRANNQLHLGNYLGGIQPMVNIQQNLKSDDKLLMFVPDLHSISASFDNSTPLYEQTLQNIKLYLACGIDIQNSQTSIYRQSKISAHSEMMWLINCFTYFGEMQRMTQFKDKSQSKGEHITLDLFNYPVLMASDILLYSADYIPVGADQRQHIELTRDLAARINNKFGKQLFHLPKPWNEQIIFNKQDESIRIRSLQNPTQKMSKSITDPKGTILLSDKPEDAAKKIMSAVTDNLQSISWNWDTQPGITNLLQINQLLASRSREEVIKEWNGKEKYGELKKETAELVANLLQRIQTNLGQINNSQVLQKVESHEQVVRQIANQKLEQFKQTIGL